MIRKYTVEIEIVTKDALHEVAATIDKLIKEEYSDYSETAKVERIIDLGMA